MGETDLIRVPMATDGPDVTDEALLAFSVLLEFVELYLQKS
jgi:hypothetical protein